MLTTGAAFIDQSRKYLDAEYLPKVRRCIAALAEEDVWWRPNAASNSIGNLLLHLAGNIRQWVVSGAGGEPDIRERQQEFDAKEGLSRSDLLALLERTLRDVDRVLSRLDAEQLSEQRVIQGRKVSVLQAIYHGVEHFAMHTGQIIYVTKLRTSKDVKFYEIEAGIPWPRW